jgi:hypothetical protein
MALAKSLNEAGLEIGDGPQFSTGQLEEIGVAAVTGPEWNPNTVAPIRMLIGTKP